MKKDVARKPMLAAGVILVAASMALAKFPLLDFGHSAKRSAAVEIYQTARISGGPILQSGEYKVVLSNNSSTPETGVYQHGKLVVQVPAKLVDMGKKFDETDVYYDAKDLNNQVIKGMDLSGWTEEVLFGQNNADARSTK